MSETPSDTDTGKVLNLKEKLAKAKEKNLIGEDGKVKKHLVVTITAGLLAGERVGEDWPEFKDRFLVKKDRKGQQIYLREGQDKILSYVSFRAVSDAVVAYWFRQLPDIFARASLLTKDADECVRLWAGSVPEFKDDILAVAQKSEDAYCFHKLDFDFDVTGGLESGIETPLFNELLSRISNRDALMAWIGSLFDPKSDRQQYVWLYGAANSGKSSIGRFLTKALGPGTRYENEPPRHGDKFWTSGLIESRLVVFGDCDGTDFTTSGLFKSLTGEDLVRIEEKGRAAFSIALSCKFLFFSNSTPTMEGKDADRRRAIICNVSKAVTDFGPTYEDGLWAEAPSFLGGCFAHYKGLVGRTIPTVNTDLDDICAENEECYEEFINEWLDIGDFKPEDCISANDMQKLLRQRTGVNTPRDQKMYREYLGRAHGAFNRQVWLGDGSRRRVYLRCKKKYQEPKKD